MDSRLRQMQHLGVGWVSWAVQLPPMVYASRVEVLPTAHASRRVRRAWREVYASAADDIGPALDALIARLTELRADLHSGRTVDDVFEDVAKWRAELMKGRES